MALDICQFGRGLKEMKEQMSIYCTEEADYTTTQNGAKELF